MNEFQTVKKFLVLTEIGLKRFDKHSFNGGEVERSTSLGKDKEFGVTVLAGREILPMPANTVTPIQCL